SRRRQAHPDPDPDSTGPVLWSRRLQVLRRRREPVAVSARRVRSYSGTQDRTRAWCFFIPLQKRLAARLVEMFFVSEPRTCRFFDAQTKALNSGRLPGTIPL